MIRSEGQPGIYPRKDMLKLAALSVVVYASSASKEQENPFDIPKDYLDLYQQYGGRAVWPILASIGRQESNHGRSTRVGVREGKNFIGCCVGPMQFNITNGPPSTWDEMGKAYQGQEEPIPGRKPNPYDPKDAIPSARDLLVQYGVKHDPYEAISRYSGYMEGYANAVLKRAVIYNKLYPFNPPLFQNR